MLQIFMAYVKALKSQPIHGIEHRFRISYLYSLVLEKLGQPHLHLQLHLLCYLFKKHSYILQLNYKSD